MTMYNNNASLVVQVIIIIIIITDIYKRAGLVPHGGQ